MKSVTALTFATALGQASAQFNLAGISPSAISGIVGSLPASFGGILSGGIAQTYTNGINRGYGKTYTNVGANLRRQELPARQAAEVPGSKTIKIRYGPYSVMNMGKATTSGEYGALWNYADQNVEKPCEKCVIVGMNAGLEYPDGRNANIDTGAWLHHFVLFNQGPGRVDQTCQGKLSLPHANVGTDPNNAERMFSSGNERTPAILSKWVGADGGKMKPVGYHVKPSDKFHMIVDLMNETMEDKIYFLTITYDLVDGHPAGFDDMRPVWFDIDQCGLSEKEPLRQSGNFQIPANTWYATMDGEILGYAGHLHDGGQRVALDVDGRNVCNSDATYGGSKEYVADGKMMQMGMMNKNSAMEHISKMSICQGSTLNVRQMKKGQGWKLTAYYDYNKNKGVLSKDGHQEPIMGIAIMYVRQPFRG